MGDLVFGDSKSPAPAPAHESGWGTSKPDQDLVDKLYAQPEPQKELYPVGVSIGPKVSANLTELGDATGLSVDAQAAERNTFIETVGAVGLDVQLSEALHTAFTHERIAATRPADETREAHAAAEEAAIREELRQQYGDRLYGDLLSRAQKFVAEHPKLKAIIGTGRVGSRPAIVRGLIEHVKAVNYR